MTSFFRKLSWLLRRPDKEAELQEELQFHLEEEAAERQAQGVANAEARRAARRELGNVALVQDDTRHLGLDIRGSTRSGHSLRPSHDSRQQNLQRDGDPVARPRVIGVAPPEFLGTVQGAKDRKTHPGPIAPPLSVNTGH
jgi:hypothetical protein